MTCDVFDYAAEHSREFAEWLGANFVRKDPSIESMPLHYRGDGIVSCQRAERSMLAPTEGLLTPMQVKWLTDAFEYVWRAPLKNGAEDIDKAIDCLERFKKEACDAGNR